MARKDERISVEEYLDKYALFEYGKRRNRKNPEGNPEYAGRVRCRSRSAYNIEQLNNWAGYGAVVSGQEKEGVQYFWTNWTNRKAYQVVKRLVATELKYQKKGIWLLYRTLKHMNYRKFARKHQPLSKAELKVRDAVRAHLFQLKDAKLRSLDDSEEMSEVIEPQIKRRVGAQGRIVRAYEKKRTTRKRAKKRK